VNLLVRHPRDALSRLLSLTLPFNGDPIDTGPLDSFAFEVHERFRRHDRATSVTR